MATTASKPRKDRIEIPDHPIMQKMRLMSKGTHPGSKNATHWLDYLIEGAARKDLVMPPYEPSSDKMAAFHRAPHKIRTVFGGNGSGKTEGGAYDLVRFVVTHPGCTAWACGVTYDAVGEYIWPKIKKYLPEEMLRTAKIAWVSPAREIPAIIRLPLCMNAEIRFKSYEQGRRKFQGSAVDYAWMDEEPSHEIFNEIVARVSRKRGLMTLTMTPLMGLTWAYEKIESAPIDSTAIWKTRIATGENKFFPAEELEDMIATFGADEAIRRIAGEFMQPAGAIWSEWRLERNVVPPFPVDNEQPRLMGVDFGFSAPFACTWTMKRNGKYYVIGEYQQDRLLLEDHIAKLRKDYGHMLHNTKEIVADPESAADRAALKKAFPGIRVHPAKNAWQLGIDTVNRALKSRAEQEPLLYVFQTCKQVIYSASVYKVKPGTDRPLNEASHLPDTIRYQMMHYLKPDPKAPQWHVSKTARIFGGHDHVNNAL